MQIILLLAILGGLALLLVQNWSPVLPLVFLGLTTPALPLAVWILFSLAAGGFTTLAIASLFNLANYFAQPKPSKKRQVQPPPRSQPFSNTPPKRPTPQASSSSNSNDDDWLEDPLSDEDWQLEEKPQDSQNKNTDAYPQDSRSYEVNSEPKSSKRQGSVYSYSYREPESSGVGKSESVYDADYRVLTPPYKSPNPVQNEEDWGFEDDSVDEEDDWRSPP